MRSYEEIAVRPDTKALFRRVVRLLAAELDEDVTHDRAVRELAERYEKGAVVPHRDRTNT